jgi:hypothetical protein
MSGAFPVSAFSLLCPWLALVCVFQFLIGNRIGGRGPLRLIIAGVAAIGVLALPVTGFSVAGWIRGIEANFSIPLTAIIANHVWENESGRSWLNPTEKLTAWIFGVVGGVFLYPLALGLGSVDPYEWGWRSSPLFVAVAIFTVWLLWKRNRFGIVLLLATLAYNLRLLESNNYWDYLVDPVYVAGGLVVLIVRLIPGLARRAPALQQNDTRFSGVGRPADW